MKKIILLLIIPFLSFSQNYINVEFQLKSGFPEYLRFDIPSNCIEISGETLPPDAPENTICMYVCDDNVIMFLNDWDIFSRNNKMHEKEDIVKQFKTKKIQEIFKKNLEEDLNTKVKKVSFEYVNDMPALKAEAVYKGQVNILTWEIYNKSRRIGVTVSAVNTNYFKHFCYS